MSRCLRRPARRYVNPTGTGELRPWPGARLCALLALTYPMKLVLIRYARLTEQKLPSSPFPLVEPPLLARRLLHCGDRPIRAGQPQALRAQPCQRTPLAPPPSRTVPGGIYTGAAPSRRQWLPVPRLEGRPARPVETRAGFLTRIGHHVRHLPHRRQGVIT